MSQLSSYISSPIMVVYDQKPGPDNTQAPQALDPAHRPFMNPMGFAGVYGGYGSPAPLDIWMMWAMYKYPMIRKVSAKITEPILAGTRSIQIDDNGGDDAQADKIKKAAERALLPALAQAMPGALEAPHFGHWLSEIVWADVDGYMSPVDVQSAQEAIVHVDEHRRFTGYQLGQDFRDSRYGFLAVHKPHIDPVLGYSNCLAALTSWYRATKCAENADALDRKASGIQMFLHIAQGMTFTDAAGNTIQPTTIATNIMNAAIQGKSCVMEAWAFPKEAIAGKPELADVPLVKVDKFDWGNMGPAMGAALDRKRDLDVDICSAWGVPERAVMESEHGSRADAEAHGDVVTSISENLHLTTCQQWDKQVTNRWLAANFPDSKVKIKTLPAPLADPQQSYKQKLVVALATNAGPKPDIALRIDEHQLLEGTEIPVLSKEDADKAIAQQKLEAQQKQEADAQANADAAANGNGKPGANGNRIKELDNAA